MTSDVIATVGNGPAPSMRRIIGVSMALGPLFGLLAIAVGTGVYFAIEHLISRSPRPATQLVSVPFAIVVYGLFFAHVFGAIPALLGGWLTGRDVAAHGCLRYATALRHGAVSGALAEVCFLAFGSFSKSLTSDFNALFWLPTYLAACCAASLGCAWTLRRQFPALKAGD
jgi:uncharacterized membrane protein YvlD (DUF360 family)